MYNSERVNNNIKNNFKKLKSNIGTKLSSNTSSRKILTGISKNYWLAKRNILFDIKKSSCKDFDLDPEFNLSRLNDVKFINDTTLRIKDNFCSLEDIFKEIGQIENFLCALFQNDIFDKQLHSTIMMNKMSDVLQTCAHSKTSFVSVTKRFREQLESFINCGISDCIKNVKTTEKNAAVLQASLMWLQNLSKDFDPEQYSKMSKLDEAKLFVKESRENLNSSLVKANEKVSLLSSSRNLLFTKEMSTYLEELCKYFESCKDSFEQFNNEFDGLPFYKFNILESKLGPNNGEDDTKLDKYLIDSKLQSKYQKDLEKKLENSVNEQLIDLTIKNEDAQYEENINLESNSKESSIKSPINLIDIDFEYSSSKPIQLENEFGLINSHVEELNIYEDFECTKTTKAIDSSNSADNYKKHLTLRDSLIEFSVDEKSDHCYISKSNDSDHQKADNKFESIKELLNKIEAYDFSNEISCNNDLCNEKC